MSQHLQLSDRLKEQIADQFTIAVNGGDARDCYARTIHLIESASLLAGEIKKTPQIYFSAAVPALPEIPEDIKHLCKTPEL